MLDALLAFAENSFAALREAVRSMLWPAVAFFLLGCIVKGKALFTDIARAAAQSSLNLQIGVFNVVFVAPLIALAATAMDTATASYGLQLVPGSVWAGLPAWLVLAAGVFIGDFVGYWRHRLEHTPLLWPSHAVHHSDTEMTWLTLERFHPINRVTTFVVDTMVLILLGLPIEAVVANNLVRHYYGYFIHADLPWTFGPLGLIFVSPAMHRWHHAADPAAFDTNYATVFSVFDRAFGTFRVPGPCTVPLGVTNDMAATLTGQLGYAFSKRAYRGLFRNRKKAAD
jgi:sterol desaturase/sphingolipid hydroxylase (fatty acid hydroxylase superfamily)